MSSLAGVARQNRLIPFGNRTHARVGHRSKINLLNVGWLCVIAAAALTLLGISAIASVPRPDEPDYAAKHFQFLVLGIVAAGVVAMPHYRVFQRLSLPLMLLVLGTLPLLG